MKKNLPLILLAMVFLAMALISAWQLFGILYEYWQGERTYDDLTQYVSTPTPPAVSETPEATPVPDDTVWPQVDFDALQAINDDVVGWIYLEDTHVNYPIVRGDDNDYYLNRLYDRTGNGSGSIFMDYRNSGDFTDRNNVIYGHRMNNGTMFADITKYTNHGFFDEHPYFLIMTPDANYKMEVFSAYVANVTYPSWDLSFTGDEQFLTWIEGIEARTYFERDMEFTAEDRVVTLSTCAYEFENARFVVHGILREAE